MNITDPKLRLLLLAELVRNPVGLTPSQAIALRALSSDELVRLANMPEPRLTLALDDSIELGLRRVCHPFFRAKLRHRLNQEHERLRLPRNEFVRARGLRRGVVNRLHRVARDSNHRFPTVV